MDELISRKSLLEAIKMARNQGSLGKCAASSLAKFVIQAPSIEVPACATINQNYSAADVLKEIAFLKASLECAAASGPVTSSSELSDYLRGIYKGYVGAAKWLGLILEKFPSALEDA